LATGEFVAEGTGDIRRPTAGRADHEDVLGLGDLHALAIHCGRRHNRCVRPLTTDLTREHERPYFLWDEDRSIAEFRRALLDAGPAERRRLIGKLMREARDPDVWQFVTPREVWTDFGAIQPYLGRRRVFWTYLLTGWHRDGFLA
jgi:hypothetical protein